MLYLANKTTAQILHSHNSKTLTRLITITMITMNNNEWLIVIIFIKHTIEFPVLFVVFIFSAKIRQDVVHTI